ncbi:MAG: flippase [Planctomycetes bacterium]|nr:flippase [Planctomycetota bacterium]
MTDRTDTNPGGTPGPPSSDHRRVLGNFVALTVVQFANYLAPLITLPYLFRVLGPSCYGLTELARAISIYFLILTDYGFSFSATKEISVHRDDPQRVSEVFSCVLLLKFLLVLLGWLILALVVFLTPRLRADWPVYFLSFSSVFGMWLFPLWLFQGLERMKYVPVLNVTAKTLVVIGVFVFIHDPADYLLAPLLQSAGTILIGVAGLVLALCTFPVRFRMPSWTLLRHEFLNGWHLFLSRAAVTLYTTSNAVILGLCTDTTFVGYYAAGDKIVRAAGEGLLAPLSQAIFPHVSRLASQSRQGALRFTARVAVPLITATALISASLLLAAPHVARIALGRQSEGSVPVIRILALLPLIVSLSNLFGVQVMVNFGLKRAFARILITAGVLNIGLAVALVVPLKHIGAALASLTTEIFVVTTMLLVLHRHGLHVFRAGRKDVDKQEPAT